MKEYFWIDKIKILGFEFIEFPDGYINGDSLVTYKCKLGHLSTRKLGDLSYLKNCMVCSEIHKIQRTKECNTTKPEKAFQMLFKMHGNSIIMTNYVRMGFDANFECTICGYKWIAFPTTVLVTGSGCLNCYQKLRAGKSAIIPLEEIKQKIYNIHGNKISIINYTTSKGISDFICNICGHTWQTTAYSVITGCGCQECYFKNNTGENHFGWKGGITPISNYLRNKISDWVKDCFSSYNWTCDISGKKAQVVHHLYPFHRIIQESFDNLNIKPKNEVNNYSEKELELITNEVLRLHSFYLNGVALTAEIHDLFHNLYSKDATIENYYEFKSKIQSGEIKIS